jgi:hypothetical protein
MHFSLLLSFYKNKKQKQIKIKPEQLFSLLRIFFFFLLFEITLKKIES